MALKTLKGIYNSSKSGFTMAELVIAMLISSLVIIAIYTTYNKQQRVYTAQDQVVEVQQNLRAGMGIMTREIRMAGCDPQETGLYGITTANAGTLAFTADTNNDGGSPGSGESYQYQLYDSDGDGTPDALRRTPGGSVLANNIYNLEFYYLLADGTWTTTPSASQLSSIRTVEISILARAGRLDPDFTDARTYTSASGTVWGPFNDQYRRRMLITQIKCRDTGL